MRELDGEREMMKIDMKKFKVLNVNEVNVLVNDDVSGDIVKSGVYRIMSGSRGIIEEVEFVGELNDDIFVMNEDECYDYLRENGWVNDKNDEEEMKELRNYVEEFYMVNEDDENSLIFGFTEEEFDYYVKVEV